MFLNVAKERIYLKEEVYGHPNKKGGDVYRENQVASVFSVATPHARSQGRRIYKIIRK